MQGLYNEILGEIRVFLGNPAGHLGQWELVQTDRGSLGTMTVHVGPMIKAVLSQVVSEQFIVKYLQYYFTKTSK